MQYVYILISKKEGEFYTGCTNNLKRRIEMHNKGQVFSTKDRKLFELVFYEAFRLKEDAFQREKWLKTGWGRNHIQKMLSNYLKSLGAQERSK